jgi:hypothetical protein
VRLAQVSFPASSLKAQAERDLYRYASTRMAQTLAFLEATLEFEATSAVEE